MPRQVGLNVLDLIIAGSLLIVMSIAALNDLVRHQNACEEKKLKFKLSQLENLKNTYSRQKDKEKMYFAVQYTTVPVKSDATIQKFRKEMEEQMGEYGEFVDAGGSGKAKSKPMHSLIDSPPGKDHIRNLKSIWECANIYHNI